MIERPFKLAFATVHLEKVIPYSHEVLLNEPFDNEFLFIRISTLYSLARSTWSCSDTADFVRGVDRQDHEDGWFHVRERVPSISTNQGLCCGRPQNPQRSACSVASSTLFIIRPITRTGTPTEFFRRSFPYSDDLLDEWQDDVRAHVLTLSSYLSSGFFPQSSLSFMSPCGMCAYAENCGLPRNQRHADIYSDLYMDNTWSPLH